ncbi:MAG: translation initiation factor [Acidobacteriota bacterium]
MAARKDSRRVYSTESPVNPKFGSSTRNSKRSGGVEEPVPDKVVAKLRIEKSGRGGKTVTVVYDLPRNKSFLKSLAGDLKKACGSGGKAGDGKVEIQGDKRDAIRQLLQSRGWVVKG